MVTIKFEPKIFILPPYLKCPKCGKESFGILTICDNHYYRRCKECFYEESYPLPRLNKKIIYIDQLAISNMMKVLNPQTEAYQKGTLDEFWLRLFKRLDNLCKLQLIICPESGFHTDESLVSSYFEPLKRMYELLSYGASFDDHKTIEVFQIYEHAKNWIVGKENEKLNLDVHSVMNGQINAWQDRLRISVNFQYDQDWKDDLRKARERKHEGLSKAFRRWQTEKDKTFDEWFEEEGMSFGRIALQVYFDHIKKLAEIYEGHVEPTINNLFPPLFSFDVIRSIHEAFREVGVQDSEIWPRTIEYLTSPSLKNIPFIKIFSMLCAALARKAAAGKKEPPGQGMANDIEIISVLLPYCDAIFIDKECHSYLEEKPLSDVIGDYGTKIFSLRNKEEFLGYLNEIETKASKEHLDRIDEVYGKTWREPYTSLYQELKK